VGAPDWLFSLAFLSVFLPLLWPGEAMLSWPCSGGVMLCVWPSDGYECWVGVSWLWWGGDGGASWWCDDGGLSCWGCCTSI